MRRLAWLVLVLGSGAILVATGQTAPAQSGSGGTLRLVDTQRLTLAGTGFRPHERVRVTATADTDRATVYRTASPAGTFRATFIGLSAGRCDLVRAVAIGRAGTRVLFKRLPPPACISERSPG